MKSKGMIVRTGAGLRDALFDMMEQLRDGGVDVSEAREFGKLAAHIIESVKVQMEHERMRAAGMVGEQLTEIELTKSLIAPVDE